MIPLSCIQVVQNAPVVSQDVCPTTPGHHFDPAIAIAFECSAGVIDCVPTSPLVVV